MQPDTEGINMNFRLICSAPPPEGRSWICRMLARRADCIRMAVENFLRIGIVAENQNNSVNDQVDLTPLIPPLIPVNDQVDLTPLIVTPLINQRQVELCNHPTILELLNVK